MVIIIIKLLSYYVLIYLYPREKIYIYFINYHRKKFSSENKSCLIYKGRFSFSGFYLFFSVVKEDLRRSWSNLKKYSSPVKRSTKKNLNK